MGHISLIAARPGSRIAAVLAAVVGLAALTAPLIGAAELKLPAGVTEAHANRMYTEQVDSAASIDQLVEGRIGRLQVLRRAVSAKTALLDVRVTYKNGVSRTAKLKLTKASGKWYFASITAAGRTGEPGDLIGDPDTGVLNTMLKEQSQHSTATAGLVTGLYDRVLVGAPQDGYRSVVLPVTFEGKSRAKGEVTCVQRSEAGRDQWFVVSFAQ